MIDRLPVVFAARPMRGNQQWLDIPPFRRPSINAASEIRHNATAVEASRGEGNLS